MDGPGEGSGPAGESAPARAARRTRGRPADAPPSLHKRILLLLFVASPFAVLAILMWLIAISIPGSPQSRQGAPGAAPAPAQGSR
jgi:hypothetical protein